MLSRLKHSYARSWIGQVSAAALVAYIDDIRRFQSAEKLTACLGLDCRVHESGASIHGKGYLTKRGNRYLRHYISALCAVERKLVHLIYAVWIRGTPFETR